MGTVLHSFALNSTVLFCSLYCIVLNYTVLSCTVLSWPGLSCTVMYCTVLWCTMPTCQERHAKKGADRRVPRRHAGRAGIPRGLVADDHLGGLDDVAEQGGHVLEDEPRVAVVGVPLAKLRGPADVRYGMGLLERGKAQRKG